MKAPTLHFELECKKEGYETIAGLDEVGRGCLAGPVVAAVVILELDNIPKGINDSKRLCAATREWLDMAIRQSAVAFAIGSASVEEIDAINIFRASKLAMLRAVQALPKKPEILLVDGQFSIDSHLPQLPIVQGDQKSLSIAAASIVAKVFRDGLMVKLDAQYPGYGFAKHKGYGSQEHRRFLSQKGPTPLHRKTFHWSPV